MNMKENICHCLYGQFSRLWPSLWQ